MKKIKYKKRNSEIYSTEKKREILIDYLKRVGTIKFIKDLLR